MTAQDGPGDDSDLKWLQVVRGERKGVAKMMGLDLHHVEELREEKRRRSNDVKKARGKRSRRENGTRN